MAHGGRLQSVNAARLQTYEWLGRAVSTAIFKRPVDGAVTVAGVNVAGDEQADRAHHGGPDKAIYAYAAEDLRWWSLDCGRSFQPGAVGENLTVAGVDVTGAVIGERWRIGGVLLEVAQPRIPCFKLGLALGERLFPTRFAAACRPGAYLRIIEEGELAAGDTVEVEYRPVHGVAVGLVARAYHRDPALAPAVLAAPQLPASWRAWAAARLA